MEPKTTAYQALDTETVFISNTSVFCFGPFLRAQPVLTFEKCNVFMFLLAHKNPFQSLKKHLLSIM